MLTQIAAPGGMAEVLVARPRSGKGPHPGVLLFTDAFGIRPQVLEMAQRIADWGYVVMVPNVFYREGKVTQLDAGIDMAAPGGRAAALRVSMPRVARLTTDLAVADARAWVDALTRLEGVDPGPIGVVGYCMGARLAVRTACVSSRVAACGGFHGGGLASDLPDSPHLALDLAKAEFVFGHADHDPGMDADAVARLGQALADAGLVAINEVYPDAAHGFTQADTDVYDDEATERHFRELKALFARTL